MMLPIAALFAGACQEFKRALRAHRIDRLAQTERAIERINHTLQMAYLAEPTSRHPAYGEFKVNVGRVQNLLEKQIARRAKLQRKLGVKIG